MEFVLFLAKIVPCAAALPPLNVAQHVINASVTGSDIGGSNIRG